MNVRSGGNPRVVILVGKAPSWSVLTRSTTLRSNVRICPFSVRVGVDNDPGNRIDEYKDTSIGIVVIASNIRVW